MVSYQLIEPSPLHRLHMNQTSSLYEVYVQYLKRYDKQTATQLTKKYCLEHSPKSIEDQIAYLEFLYMNDYYSELEYFIKSKELNKDVSLLYWVLLNRRHKTISIRQLTKIESLKFTHPTLRCLHTFIIVYSYYDIKKYTGLDKYLEQCDQALNLLNEPLVNYYMQLRFNELLFLHYWKTNNPLLAQKYAYKIINTELSARKVCRTYHNLALCNLYNGYASSMDHALIALDIAETNNLTQSAKAIKQQTIPFISAFHRKTQNISTPDPVESAHLAIGDGDYGKATRILKNLKSLTPFQECYLGLATENKEMLEHAYFRFIHELGDQFFALLPKYYLKRL